MGRLDTCKLSEHHTSLPTGGLVLGVWKGFREATLEEGAKISWQPFGPLD